MHVSTIALVWNLMTGKLSPQCHVFFDPWSETVLDNGTTVPAALDVMLSQCNHEVDVETDDNDLVGATLSDD